MADDSDRVIPATPRRREAARRQGAMPTAALPAWVATAGTAILLLPLWWTATAPAAADLTRAAIRAAGAGRPFDPWAGLTAVATPTVAVVVAAAVTGLAVRLLLDGFSWQPARIVPSLRRIDPFAGLTRIFSGQTATNIVGAAAGLAVMTIAAAFAVRPLVALAAAGLGAEARVAAAAWRAAAWLFAAAAVVAACRWLAARRRFERRIRMTPEEFAEEARSAQADPKVRLLRQQQRRQPTAGAA